MLVLVLALCFVFFAAVLEVWAAYTNVVKAHHCGTILKTLRQSDPEDDSDDFYLIQNPVEESNMGDKFKPKLPHLLAKIPNAKKLEVVKMLTAENEVRLGAFFDRIQSDSTIPLQRVNSMDVNNYGKVCVKYSRKTDESILAKVSRPEYS